MADKTQSEDAGKRFEAYGWDVVTINGHEIQLFADVCICVMQCFRINNTFSIPLFLPI
jgi:transketolase N-terminal domain/subunit